VLTLRALLHIVVDNLDIMSQQQATSAERQSHSKTNDSNVRQRSMGGDPKVPKRTCKIWQTTRDVNRRP
jgi:hypothetical protein